MNQVTGSRKAKGMVREEFRIWIPVQYRSVCVHGIIEEFMMSPSSSVSTFADILSEEYITRENDASTAINCNPMIGPQLRECSGTPEIFRIPYNLQQDIDYIFLLRKQFSQNVTDST